MNLRDYHLRANNNTFLKVWWHAATLFSLFLFIYVYSYTHTPNKFIRRIGWAPLHFPHCCSLSRGPPLGCRAENRTRGRLSAARLATVWDTPHPKIQLQILHLSLAAFILHVQEIFTTSQTLASTERDKENLKKKTTEGLTVQTEGNFCNPFPDISILHFFRWNPRFLSSHISLKGTVSRDGYFFWRSKHFNQYFLCMRWCFWRSFKRFSLPYTIINFLFASLKFLEILKTLTETLKPSSQFPSLWSVDVQYSSADLSLAAWKMRKN